MSLFHRHRWALVSARPTRLFDEDDVTVGYRTEIALRCRECGKFREQTLRGYHDLEPDECDHAHRSKT